MPGSRSFRSWGGVAARSRHELPRVNPRSRTDSFRRSRIPAGSSSEYDKRGPPPPPWRCLRGGRHCYWEAKNSRHHHYSSFRCAPSRPSSVPSSSFATPSSPSPMDSASSRVGHSGYSKDHSAAWPSHHGRRRSVVLLAVAFVTVAMIAHWRGLCGWLWDKGQGRRGGALGSNRRKGSHPATTRVGHPTPPPPTPGVAETAGGKQLPPFLPSSAAAAAAPAGGRGSLGGGFFLLCICSAWSKWCPRRP